MTIQRVTSDDDILKCRGAIQALRPLLTDDVYTDAVKQTLADNRQIIFIEDGSPDAAAVAVFETGYNLFRGKYIYIDDLSTLPTQRGKGYAGQLLDWIADYARTEGFDEIHLDSGVNAARTDAHRLYLNKRFQVASLHFVAKV
ncbi:GNAT family N-acetyltransferase [Dyadobacter fermentans]|uniref:GCN5-related N-acetyltransferase n=1 Tax=Dyadobacter fermentans (strain ATCC 700827 / DSM 18053 / CIP 107007 / KCTC 52180 / NS114) TaxID=471854 RepID=C6VYZ9_DYAFD|nr:GNAT family N-acetyltransferase [Dyadobacter fermentans]ACT95205.1 GCN5-related N-acetyltransferase [Dyadobacter fermentans DSM 18053]